MSLVRTVLGDVDAARLGRLDYHEHLFQVTPLLPGDDLDEEPASTAEARLLRESGFDAMIEATPTGLGRRPAAVARISAVTGLHVVAVTGAHREEHYRPDAPILRLSEAQLAARFVADVRNGLPAEDRCAAGAAAEAPDGTPVRAGMLKAGVGYWRISRFERRVLAAVAAAAQSTGVSVMVHLEQGSAAVEVLELLVGDGVPADAVVLAHVDRNPDAGLHLELAQAGAYLGYDGWARTARWPDSVLLDCLVRVVDAGGSARVVLGGDVARRTRYLSYGGMPGLGYLGRRVVPRLRQALGEDGLRELLVDNPARLLGLRDPRPPGGRALSGEVA